MKKRVYSVWINGISYVVLDLVPLSGKNSFEPLYQHCRKEVSQVEDLLFFSLIPYLRLLNFEIFATV